MEKLRRDFVSNVAHELRAPVTVLRSSLEALCDGVVSDEEQAGEYHRNMLSETLHLQRMISDLLELSRLQNPDFSIHYEPVDLCQVVTGSVRSANQLVQAKHIDLSAHVPAQESMVSADEGCLRQMLLILIDNAIKFSGENSIVQIVLQQQAEGYALQVMDQGSVRQCLRAPTVTP